MVSEVGHISIDSCEMNLKQRLLLLARWDHSRYAVFAVCMDLTGLPDTVAVVSESVAM
jgi:hypothetical protein